MPLVEDPGCGPPLLPPLAADPVLVGAFGDDLVSGVMTFCAPLRSGITLPTNSVAISGAKVRDALHTTPALEAARNARKGEMYSRVLFPDQTQVTAMLAQHPTFVSVELAANEHGYAYFSLESLYGLPKPRFSVLDVLFSSAPFGPNISLDGVHPSAQGQGILAAAAALAINARYGLAIP